MESDVIVGHVTCNFLAQVLAPRVLSGKITSIDAVCKGEPNACEGKWVLERGTEIPYIGEIYGC